MTESSPDPVPDPPDLDPGTLAGAGFTRVRKGFEPVEVRSLLGRSADALRAWKERDDRLTARLAGLEDRLSESQELDEQRITAVLGEETARIVAAAREAAAEIQRKAREQADRMVAQTEEAASAAAQALTAEATRSRDAAALSRNEAVAESDRLLAEAHQNAARLTADAQAAHDEMMARASTVLDERTIEAEAAAAGIRQAAEAEMASARVEGERIRDQARDAAGLEVDRARSEGREMVAEARRLRRQMLHDLAERRRTARRQIEAARAGRDRIVESLRETGESVASVIGGLTAVDDEAQRSADAAAAAVDDDIDSVVAELETGLATGGLDIVDDEDERFDDGSPPLDDDSGALGVDGTDRHVPTASPVADIGTAASEERDDRDADEDRRERSPGATVHDLFERIRAERTPADDPIDLTVSDPTAPDPLDEATMLDDVQLQVAVALGEIPVLDRRDDLLGAAEKSLARTLKRLVSDEQNEVLDRLRRIKRGRPHLADLLPEGPDADRFVDALRSEFRVAAEAGSAFWAEQDHGSLAGPVDQDRLDRALTPRVVDLLGIRRAHVQRVLDDADAEGLELAELGDRVRAAYREWRSQSVAETAGDLATAGFAEGTRAAAGEGTPWTWVPDNGGLPCSDAEDNSLAGAVRCGAEFPTGDAFPPAHSGCRCILVPARR